MPKIGHPLKVELMGGIEPPTSPLPRECSTPELHKRIAMERAAGIEPAPSAWKAEVLPLYHARMNTAYRTVQKFGGEGRIRTFEAFAADLQSAPFGHSGTSPYVGGKVYSFLPRCQTLIRTD